MRRVALPAGQVPDPATQQNFEAMARWIEAGDLKQSARPTPSPGWLLCDGSPVLRSGYPALFAAIGTAYGAGDGSTTFNLPDLRGRAAVGVDGAAGRLSVNDALGQAGGAETHTHTHGVPAHDHAYAVRIREYFGMANPAGSDNGVFDYRTNADAGWSNIKTVGSVNQVNNGTTGVVNTAVNHSSAFTSQPQAAGTGTTSASSGMPPYQVVNYFIKT